ncbi:hypothetical protein [Parasalinivibrio latis]
MSNKYDYIYISGLYMAFLRDKTHAYYQLNEIDDFVDAIFGDMRC